MSDRAQETLYLLTTRGLGDFYVLSENSDEAERHLMGIFQLSGYGFQVDRKVVNIKPIVTSFQVSLRDKCLPNLSNKDKRLLIVKDWPL